MWPAPGIITKLWASPSGEAFAVMPGSALQRFDGVRWTVVPIDLSQLFGSERGALWAAGNCGGIAVHCVGLGAHQLPAVDDYLLTASATAPNDVWVQGWSLWHFDGTNWSKAPSVGDTPQMAWARSPNDAWRMLVGQHLELQGLWRWNGASWNPFVGPPTKAVALTGNQTGPWIVRSPRRKPAPLRIFKSPRRDKLSSLWTAAMAEPCARPQGRGRGLDARDSSSRAISNPKGNHIHASFFDPTEFNQRFRSVADPISLAELVAGGGKLSYRRALSAFSGCAAIQ
jgi:hypothetical protein